MSKLKRDAHPSREQFSFLMRRRSSGPRPCELILAVANSLHPPGGNNHKAAFAAYVNSSSWTAFHRGLFVVTAVIIAGLLVLFFALNVSQGTPRWVGFFAAISAEVALALVGVVYAVDGVALKQQARTEFNACTVKCSP